ncbi:TonB-dependent receptor [Microbulbifer thermotolerans]|uniref:TonB-dependent receptor n=1 Tax=Microbulbifer thermotolerans TaxID=252514 RepID=UPI00224B2772|nr:TonB-dependent receptor [Microbulbifer thermotolerans]MCX2781136.1 TonB-dependent receptor [Microbulbifer thermotolerans]MCX2782981.1 TonB-dependent receptor [Microbulbifer thermotolerans]MCX2804753.1 TonB-dependent receptor [Microbulbifer thermotolerans]MCX2841613.1 TonB-dependent receptor [Microbulbifer thermotolerans]
MNSKIIHARLMNVPLAAIAAAIISFNAVAEQNQALETVTVTAQAANASSDIERQRNSNKMVAVQTSEAIGELPDANVTEALQRMPGVFIVRDQGEGRFVGVRGIDPNLNASTINGVSLPAPETDSRAVAMDVIPSDLLSSLEVFKTLTPDMSADSIGGAIEIKSLSALDRDGRHFKLSVENSYSELQEENSPKLAGTFTDRFELDGGRELGVAIVASHQARNFGSENIETDGIWEKLTAVDGSEAFGAVEIEQRDYTITRERTGLAANFDLRLSESSQLYLHTLYSDFSDEEERQRNSWKLDEENDDPASISASSAVWEDAALEKSLKDRLEEQEILSVVFGGEHQLDQWGIEYALGYSQAEEAEPHRRDTDFVQEGLLLGYTSAGEKPQMAVGADDLEAALTAANYALDELVIEDNFTEDEEISFRLDFSREIQLAGKPSELKFGLHERRREKSGDLNATVYDGFGADYTLADFAMGQVDYDLAAFGPGINKRALNRFIDANLSSFEVDEAETALGSARDYVMSEDISAVYVMNTIELERAQLVYGVRYEATDFSADGYRVIESGEAVPGAEEVAEDVYVSPVHYQRDYSNLFPSVNLKYDFSDNIVLRAAYTESLSRPSFGYLNPSPAAIEYDEGELEVEAGNPALDPYEARNLDFSAEYYADRLGMFSVSFFHKRIDNFIVVADVAGVVDVADYVGSLPVDDAEILQPVNGDTATLTGAELAWTQGFDNGLLLRANATFTDSEASLGLGPDAQRSDDISLPNQADLVGNFIIGYERDAFSLRLSTTFRGERLLEVNMEDAGGDRYEDDHMQVDLSAKYRFENGLQLTFSGVNLTDEPLFVHNAGYNGQYEEYGPTYVLGLTYSTF